MVAAHLLTGPRAPLTWQGQAVPAEAPAAVSLPTGQDQPAPEDGPAKPAPPASPYRHVWTVAIEGEDDVRLIATATRALTAAASLPVEARGLSDGHVVWASPLTAADLAHADNRVFGVSANQVYALDEATGDLAWQVQTDAPGHHLAVGPSHLLVLSQAGVGAFGRANGTAAWRTPLPAPPSTGLAVSAGLVVVGLQDRSVVALDAATGELRWRATLDDIPRAVTAVQERVYVTLPLVAVCALMPSDGRLDWCTTELRVPAVGPPVLQGERLYLALLDTTLRAFDPDTGTMLQRDSLLGRPVSAPVPMGATLVTPLSQNGFGVVRPNGSVAVVPAPDAPPMRSARGLAISDDGSTIVMLTIEIAGSLHLSAYTAAPAATAPAPVPAAPASEAPAPAASPEPSAPAGAGVSPDPSGAPTKAD